MFLRRSALATLVPSIDVPPDERRDHLVVRKEYDVPLTVILTTQVHHMAIGGTVDSPITVD